MAINATKLALLVAIAGSMLIGIGACNLNPDQPRTNSCRPRRVLAVKSGVDSHHLTGAPGCTVEDDGTVTLTFQRSGCPDKNDSWWAVCTFANQDMNLFDLAWRGQGVFAADVCVDNFPKSALNLRYRSGGVEKILPLISTDPSEYASSGCRTVYLSPADSCYSTGECGKQCPDPDAGAGDARPEQDGSASVAATRADGCIDFSHAELKIVDEWCVMDPPQDASTDASDASADPPDASADAREAPETVTIRLRSLVYYPKDCACKADSDCVAPSVCRFDGWRPAAKCNEGGASCPGICAS